MSKTGVYHFHPERIAWIGGAVVAFGFAVGLVFLSQLYFESAPIVPTRGQRETQKVVEPLSFSLGLNEKAPALPIPSLQDQISFSFDPPRPVGAVESNRLLVRLKKSGESKRVVLPCRLDLEFQQDKLVFAKEKSPFWIDLALTGDLRIEGRGRIGSIDAEELDAGVFLTAGQECPIQGAQEFGEGSAFRILGEAKWWGQDLFKEGGGERLEVGSAELLELREGAWLVWKNQRWEPSPQPEIDAPIARIQSVGNKGLVVEGWDADGHVRLSFALALAPPFKTKGEELFSAIRVRSEKQISCMLEKQCIVLKTGDWVLKTGGRWKVLRKKDERDAFLNGKLFGDLFMFEQILQKQGQKVIVGKLFNSGRTQMVNIEMAAHSTRKSADKGLKR